MTNEQRFDMEFVWSGPYYSDLIPYRYGLLWPPENRGLIHDALVAGKIGIFQNTVVHED